MEKWKEWNGWNGNERWNGMEWNGMEWNETEWNGTIQECDATMPNWKYEVKKKNCVGCFENDRKLFLKSA